MSNKARRMLVLLLIILKETGPTAACSSSCSSDCYCTSRGLTSVPQDLPSTITTLNLEGNAITNLSQSDFSRYRSLTGLNLRSNQISMIHNKTFHNLTSLTNLYLQDNQLTSLTADIFVGLGNLLSLHLYQNQITNLPADIFVGLGNLRYLWLHQNQITNLPADIFVGLGNLHTLWLNQNQLTNLPADIFVGLGNLQTLYLSQNQITNLPADTFVGLGNLQTLYLQQNQITDLPADIFVGLGNLRYLYLHQNQLTSLSADIFVGLGNLQTLYLQQNQITNLSADIFVGLGNLQTLWLHQNQLTSLPADIFVGLGNLQYLSLYQNQITNLPTDIFVGLGSLERLDLRWNSIRSIEAGMFNDTTQLRSLYLQYNSISTIAANTYDLLASILTVNIHNNPWQCDCRMAPFKQRMNGSYPFENQIRCAGPGNLARQYLRDVNPEDLICEETTPVYFTLITKRIVDSTLSLSNYKVSSFSPFHMSVNSTSKAQTLSLTPSDTPTAVLNPKSTSKALTLSPTPSHTPTTDSIVNPGWSTVSTDSPSGLQSTMTQGNPGPIGGGIFLPVPLLATLCIVLVLMVICAIAFGARYMYKKKREHTSLPDFSNSNPAGTSSGNDQRRQPANINSQSEMLHPSTEGTWHIYDVPNDDADISEYDTIAEINQSPSPHQGVSNMQSLDSFGYSVLPPPLPPENQTGPQAGSQSKSAAVAGGTICGRDTWTDEAEYNDVISPSQRLQPASGQMQHLGSFNYGYEVPSSSLGPENRAHPQARGSSKSHQYENSQVIAAAKDAAAGPQFIEYENDEGIEARKEGPQSPKYENSQVIAAAKDAAAVPQAIVYQNDDESVDNKSQTAAAPGADSPNHYEPLRNPSSQQEHT